jgi:glycerophosphoryl diester phosphodiesterase
MTKALFILFVTLLFTLSGRVDAQHTDRNTLPLISAHRGASRLAPENTKASFLLAIEGGADFIEIDVRTTADGEQVIVHDKSLKRTTGLDSLVSETNFATIRKLSAGGWFGKEFIEEKVPTLEEVCMLVSAENARRSSGVMLYVDCKAIDPAGVIQLLKKYNLVETAVFYGDVQTLAGIKEHFASARLMPAFPGFGEVDQLLKEMQPYAFDVPFKKLNHATVAYIHSKGIKVFSDLLGKHDDKDSYHKVIRFDVDLIQTDDVNAVLDTYKEFETHDR